jgi:hypothetical protein
MPSLSSSPAVRAQSAIFVIAISLASLVPLAGRVAGGPSGAHENRHVRALPPLPTSVGDVGAFSEDFTDAFRSSFWLRTELVALHGRLAHLWLGRPALRPGRARLPLAVMGREGFALLLDGGMHDALARCDPPSAEALRALSAEVMRRHDEAAELGARYVLVIAPNKEMVLPEIVPPPFPRCAEGTQLEQLTRALAASLPDVVVDLTPSLRQAAKEGIQVYSLYDTHWTELGGYVAAQALLRFLDAEEALPIARFEEREERGGDLTRLLGVYGRLAERVPVVVALDAAPGPAPFAGALVSHDSFYAQLRPFLEGALAEATLVREQYPPRERLAAEQPPLVLEQVVQRRLLSASPLHPRR